jgi:hypothetical protein
LGIFGKAPSARKPLARTKGSSSGDRGGVGVGLSLEIIVPPAPVSPAFNRSFGRGGNAEDTGRSFFFGGVVVDPPDEFEDVLVPAAPLDPLGVVVVEGPVEFEPPEFVGGVVPGEPDPDVVVPLVVELVPAVPAPVPVVGLVEFDCVVELLLEVAPPDDVCDPC